MNTQISPYGENHEAYYDWLESVKVGDMVQIMFNRCPVGDVHQVTKITKTQIHIGPGYRYRKSDGEAVGSRGRRPLWIRPVE